MAPCRTDGFAIRVGCACRLSGDHGRLADVPADHVAVNVSADYCQEWDDAEGQISIVRGRCRVDQGSTILEARQMVIWRTTQSAGRGKRDRLTVYLEDDVRIEEPSSTINKSPAIVSLVTRAGVKIKIRNQVNKQPARDDSLLLRGRGLSPPIDSSRHSNNPRRERRRGRTGIADRAVPAPPRK